MSEACTMTVVETPPSGINGAVMKVTAEDWKKQAEHWKQVADAEASRCAEEYGAEIRKLRQKIKMLERTGQNATQRNQ